MKPHTDVESLDYDSFESIVNQTSVKYTIQHGKHNRWVLTLRWFFTFCIGVITALLAVGIHVGTERLGDLKLDVVKSVYRWRDIQSFVIWIGLSTVFVIVAAICATIVEPIAAGSGIPEVKSYLNGVKIPKVVRLRTLLAKVIGVIFAVGGGLPVGKEGPMIHTGAVVGAGISQGESPLVSFNSRLSIFGAFRNDHEKRDFVSCGAAAGVAAAFGAPIGGVLFVLEEGASFWHQQLTWRTFFCALTSTFTLNLVLSGIVSGQSFGLLGTQTGTFTFGKVDGGEYEVYEVPVFLLMGIGGGLLGALFNQLNTKLTQWRSRWVRSTWRRLLEAIIGGAILATLCFSISYIFGQCKPRPTTVVSHHEDLNFAIRSDYRYRENMLGFFCADPEAEYNDAATLFMLSGENAIRQLLHAPSGTFPTETLLLFLVVYFCMACWVYGLRVPSGLFVPALLMGSVYGRLWVHILQLVSQKNMYFKAYTSNEATYGLIGAAAMIGGITRMTLSLTVILLECTGTIQFGLPLMLTLFSARWIGNIFNEGLYDIHIHLRKIPFLEWEPSSLGSFLRVKHVMTHNPKCIPLIVRVGYILDLLNNTSHNGFPVVAPEEDGSRMLFAGVILRKQLAVLLKERDFTAEKPLPFSRVPPPSASVNDSTNRNIHRFSLGYRDMEKMYPSYPRVSSDRHSDVEITEEERKHWMDLSPYVNETPFMIQQEAAFPRAFRLFRGNGLRHLVVVNRQNEVKGIITRKDLTAHHVERCYRLAMTTNPEPMISPLAGHPPQRYLFLQRLTRRFVDGGRGGSHSAATQATHPSTAIPLLSPDERDLDDEDLEGHDREGTASRGNSLQQSKRTHRGFT